MVTPEKTILFSRHTLRFPLCISTCNRLFLWPHWWEMCLGMLRIVQSLHVSKSFRTLKHLPIERTRFLDITACKFLSICFWAVILKVQKALLHTDQFQMQLHLTLKPSIVEMGLRRFLNVVPAKSTKPDSSLCSTPLPVAIQVYSLLMTLTSSLRVPLPLWPLFPAQIFSHLYKSQWLVFTLKILLPYIPPPLWKGQWSPFRAMPMYFLILCWTQT